MRYGLGLWIDTSESGGETQDAYGSGRDGGRRRTALRNLRGFGREGGEAREQERKRGRVVVVVSVIIFCLFQARTCTRRKIVLSVYAHGGNGTHLSESNRILFFTYHFFFFIHPCLLVIHARSAVAG